MSNKLCICSISHTFHWKSLMKRVLLENELYLSCGFIYPCGMLLISLRTSALYSQSLAVKNNQNYLGLTMSRGECCQSTTIPGHRKISKMLP